MSHEVGKRFSAKDGCEVVLRAPKWEDQDGLLDLISSLVEEKADVFRAEKVSRGKETDWLSKVLGHLGKYEILHLVAKEDSRLVVVSEIDKRGG